MDEDVHAPYLGTLMNRRDWLRLAGSFTCAGLAGCAGTGGSSGGGSSSFTVSDRTKRMLGSGGAAFGVWQGMRTMESNKLGERLGSLSLTKSVAALAAVRAIGDGWLSADAPLTDIIPEWKSDPAKSRVTVRMLVNQSAGFAPSPAALYRGTVPDKGKRAISLPLVDAPGTRFRYGPACWEVLGEVMHRKLSADGSSLEAHLRKVTGRIGLSSPDWRKDGKDRYYLSTGAEFSVRDLGQLGRTLGKLATGKNDAGLDAAIFRDLSSPRSANPMFGAGIWWNRNARRGGAMAVEPERVLDGVYDPGFWSRACLSPTADPGWLALVGSGGKRVYVLPEKNIIIARMGRAYGWNDGVFLNGVRG